MSLSNLQIFQKQTYTAFQAMLDYNIGLFNAQSRNGLVLRTASNQGDWTENSLYARIPDLVRRRNAYGSSSLTAKDISMLLDRSVKVAAGTNPVNINPSWWSWINRAPEEPAAVIAKQLAEDAMADMVSVALRTAIAALTNKGATVVYDGTAGAISHTVLNSGSALFGDRAQSIASWVIHSTPFHALIAAGLTNTAQLFEYGTVQIRADSLGRPFIVTDDPALVYTSGGTRYHTLGLSSGGVLVEQNNDWSDNIETANGNENITRTYQAEWSYNLGLKGYAWDKDNGGASPSDAALNTGSNWDMFAESIKDTVGVLVNTQ